MRAEITINMDNAAFQDSDPGNELARILTKWGKTLQNNPCLSPGDSLPAFDINGNKVGYLAIKE